MSTPSGGNDLRQPADRGGQARCTDQLRILVDRVVDEVEDERAHLIREDTVGRRAGRFDEDTSRRGETCLAFERAGVLDGCARLVGPVDRITLDLGSRFEYQAEDR